MKIDNIDFVSVDGTNVVNFSFRDLTSENPYNINDITGLDADEITTKFRGFSEVDSSKYYSLSIEKRQLGINISLNPQYTSGETYSSLRDRLYRNISSSRTGLIKLLFKDGTTTIAQLFGFVAKLETVSFSPTPEVTITIDCDDAILKSVNPVIVNTTGFGTLPTIIDLVSTAPHGFEFGLTFTEPSDIFLMHDQLMTGWRFQTIFDFVAGDKLRFSSNPQNKDFYIIRGSETIHLIDKLLMNTVWPILFSGNNVFFISTLGDFTWDYLKHHYSYWGV